MGSPFVSYCFTSSSPTKDPLLKSRMIQSTIRRALSANLQVVRSGAVFCRAPWSSNATRFSSPSVFHFANQRQRFSSSPSVSLTISSNHPVRPTINKKTSPTSDSSGLLILEEDEDFLFVYKPAGVGCEDNSPFLERIWDRCSYAPKTILTPLEKVRNNTLHLVTRVPSSRR